MQRLPGLDASAQAAIARWAVDRTGPAFSCVWPDNADAVTAFLAAASQWRTTIADRNGRIVTRFLGLDYGGAAIAWSARGIKPDVDLFDRLTVIEMAAEMHSMARPGWYRHDAAACPGD
jgi:hypothetical protein